MSWRTVVLSKESKVSLRMNNLIVSNEDVVKIPLQEISVVMIENPSITLTGHIMNALTKENIMTVICDQQCNPATIIQPSYGHHRQAKKIKEQMSWQSERKGILWKNIVQHKITNQYQVLKRHVRDERMHLFKQYVEQVYIHDRTNREGHAAKIHFNLLFGNEFYRDKEIPINWGLDYGYSIFCSMFARTIVSKGYLTEIGIHHINEFNTFNLASDLMEVYRPMVDHIVKSELEDVEGFGKLERRKIQGLLGEKVKIKGKVYTLQASIQLYVEGCLEYLLTGDEKKLVFPSY